MQSRLEVTVSLSDKIFLGSRTGELDTGDIPANITRVNLSVDSDHYYTAGDDTGRAIEVTCPWGSQAMADSILASVSGKTYQPFTATDALLDPAAEIGDAVTVGGYYSVIADINTEFDRACAPTISAPESDEIDDEYPYESKERRETNRQLAQTRSLISKTSEEILLQVESELEGLSSSFSVQLDNITGRVNGLDGEFAELSLTLDGLTVTDSTGKTVINGSMIQTSNLYVNAANISGTLQANQINLTGAITWGDLDSDVEDRINDAYNTAYDNQLPDYIKSTYIDSTRIESPEIYGGEIYSVDGSGAYAKMESNAFSMMYSGSSVPRAVLQVSNTDATLVLGVGSGTSQDAGRFFITKSAIGGGAASVFYITNSGTPIGITFQNNGTIGFSADQITGLYMVFD